MIPNAHVSDRHYSTLKQVESLKELADYTAATVEGCRVEGRVVIPEFVTFRKFPARTGRLQSEVEPTETVRMRYSEYDILRNAYRESGTRNEKVDALISLVESYL